MHWVNVAIILCIGDFIAWIIAMYVKDAVSGLIGHVLVSALGAFIACYVALLIFPKYGTPAMIPAAFVSGVRLVYLLRFRKWNWRKNNA